MQIPSLWLGSQHGTGHGGEEQTQPQVFTASQTEHLSWFGNESIISISVRIYYTQLSSALGEKQVQIEPLIN